MNTANDPSGKWNQRCSPAVGASPAEAEAMFRLLFERSTDPIWLFDPKAGVFVDCNQAAADLMGCGTKERLLQARPADLSPPFQPDGRPSLEAAAEITELVSRNGGHRFEWMGRRHDGSEVPLEVVATPIITNGQNLHVVVSRDITDRKRRDAALRDSEQLLSSIADNISDAVYRTAPDHSLTFANRAYLQMFGYDSLDTVRSIPRERLYANAEHRQRLIQSLAEHGSFNKQEVEFVRRDGSKFWGLISSTAIRDPQTNALLYHVGSITDITQRKRMEDEILQLNANLERRIGERTAELSQSEARARTLVEHAPEAIVVFDGETGRFLQCNENATHLYGLKREDLLGRHPSEVSPPFQADGRPSLVAAREKIQQALDGQTPVFEWTHRHSSGRLIPCEVRLVRLPAEGKVLIRGSVIDNTDRKRREKIQQATYHISEAVHAVDDLEALYPRIHGIVAGLMPAGNFYLALYDAVTEMISFPYFIDEQGGKPAPFKITTGLTGYVLRTGKPLLVDREMNARKMVRNGEVTFQGHAEISYRETGTPAAIWLGVPLVIDGRAFGVMAVQDYRNEKAYGEEEKQILSFVAAQTALAIARKQSEHELRERSERVLRHRNVLLELAQMDKSNLPAALEQVCALSAATLNAARVSYWSTHGEGSRIVCELLYLASPGRVLPEAKGAALEAARYPAYFAALAQHQPIIAVDALTHPATRELAEGYLRPLGIGAMLDAPVWLHGKVVGVICHEHVGLAREWTVEEIDFASSLATMVSLALEAAQRARSEQALRESEEKHRALFEASSQGVMLHDEEKFLEVNPAAVRILGFSRPDQVVGKNPVELAPPTQPGGENSATLARRYIGECMARGSCRFEWVSLGANGELIPIEVILTRISTGGRSIIQAVINDIAERKKAEEELRQSEARLRESEARFSAAFHASPVYITIARVGDGRFIEANEAFVQWMGCSRSEILGRTSVELGVWANLEERAGYWAELERNGRVRNLECQLTNRRGLLHVMLLSGDIIEINKEPHVLTVGLDISDRKAAEVELLRALGREKELSQLKSNFVSMVSHEFRTPLGIIMSSAEILEDYLEELDRDERQHHLRSIARNTKRMSELMEEVLVLGRLDAGRMDFKPALLDLHSFCTRLVDEVHSATNRACPIETHFGEHTSAANGDERLLRHILLNLLTNAVKYSEPGRPVELVVQREERDVVCRIRDHGIGIPEGDLSWLFNAFHRGRNVGQRPGTGLGLVIVKRCAELHGGTIQVESKVGEGTLMTVRLPLFA